MNPDPSDPIIRSELVAASYPAELFARPVSWGAIFAGLVAAMGLQVLFMMLGAGLGFAIYTPLTDENPIASLSKGAAVVQGVSAIVSLWFGGWVAGRLTPLAARATGCLHGFIVWCAATIAGVLVVATGAGWAVGDLSKLVGGGLAAAGKPAAAAAGGAADLAKQALQRSGDTLNSFVEEASTGRPGNTAQAVRAKRELTMALPRLFSTTASGNQADARTSVVSALTQSGMSEADANKMIDDWTASYNRLKSDLDAAKQQAEQKAREAADKTADALATLSLAAFVAFVLGAIAGAWGGAAGAKHATRRALEAED